MWRLPVMLCGPTSSTLSPPLTTHTTHAGSPSWCFWQQALAEGVDPAVKFAQTKHDVPLPRDVSYRLVPLFECLPSEDLSRCMKLQTSNVNECLHSLVWRRAPKAKYCGKKTIEIAVALAVLQFNKGASALADAVVSLGASPGISLTTVASTIDSQRLRYAKISAKTESKTTCKRGVLEKMRKQQRMEAAEGGLYEAGGHWRCSSESQARICGTRLRGLSLYDHASIYIH